MRTPVDAEQAAHVVGVGEELRRRAGVDDLPRVEHDDVAGEALDDGEVLLDEQHGRQLGGAPERRGDLGHEQRGEALRGLVDEQHLVLPGPGACWSTRT